MCNERRNLRRDSASSIRVAVRFDTVWASKRHDFCEARRVLGQQPLIESADALRVVLAFDFLRHLAVEAAGNPGGNRDGAEHDLRLDGSDVHEKTS